MFTLICFQCSSTAFILYLYLCSHCTITPDLFCFSAREKSISVQLCAFGFLGDMCICIGLAMYAFPLLMWIRENCRQRKLCILNQQLFESHVI